MILAALGAGAAGCSLYYLMLTIQVSGQGGPSPSTPGAATPSLAVAPGKAINISATPYAGYSFVNWTTISGPAIIANPNGASTTVTLTVGDAAIQANLSVLQYTLTVNFVGTGTTTPFGPVSVDYGAQTSITATTTGTFVNWTVASGTATIAAPTSATTTVTLTSGSATIQANFTP